MSINIIIATLNNDFKALHSLLDPLTEKNQQLAESQECPDINFQEQTYGNTALHYAVKRGNFEMVEALLFYGASRDIKNFHGVVPMDEYENHSSDPIFYYQNEAAANDNNLIYYQNAKTLKNAKRI